jgi:hypothetical protein
MKQFLIKVFVPNEYVPINEINVGLIKNAIVRELNRHKDDKKCRGCHRLHEFVDVMEVANE